MKFQNYLEKKLPIIAKLDFENSATLPGKLGLDVAEDELSEVAKH